MDQKVVVHFIDGQIIKGQTYDFFHTKPSFHLRIDLADPSSPPTLIAINDLKAVFFVKTYDGNPEYRERKEFTSDDKAYGRKIGVTFNDGELLVGTCNAYDLDEQGFFVFPVDPASNNIRIYAISSSVEKVDEITL